MFKFINAVGGFQDDEGAGCFLPELFGFGFDLEGQEELLM
jgi:hypothetical protein